MFEPLLGLFVGLGLGGYLIYSLIRPDKF